MISKINRLVYASLFLALALVLPFLTGQIPQIGAMMTPMHFPVLLCGFLGVWFGDWPVFCVPVWILAPLACLHFGLMQLQCLFPGFCCSF